MVGNPTLDITIEHRNADETTWSSAGTFSSITACGTASVEVSSLKQLVRIKYEFDAGDDTSDGVHFYMQAPTWRPV